MENLSYWVDWMCFNIKYPIVEIIGLVIAVFGFLLPWRSAYNKHIDVYWGEPQIIDCSFRPGGTCHPQKAFMVRLQIVNTSNIDVGYFDLSASAAKDHQNTCGAFLLPSLICLHSLKLRFTRLFYCANTNCRTRVKTTPQANHTAFSDSVNRYQIDAYIIVGFIFYLLKIFHCLHSMPRICP